MPVPTSISELSTTAGSNSPASSESVITTDDYIRAHAAFIAQLDEEKLDASGVSAFGATLIDDADEAAARDTLGTDVYKTLPSAGANLETGEVYVATAGFTLNTGLTAGNIYPIYNNSAAAITITQGSGVTLRRAGTTLTGNATLAARGMASLWCLSTTEYIISGAGLS